MDIIGRGMILRPLVADLEPRLPRLSAEISRNVLGGELEGTDAIFSRRKFPLEVTFVQAPLHRPSAMVKISTEGTVMLLDRMPQRQEHQIEEI